MWSEQLTAIIISKCSLGTNQAKFESHESNSIARNEMSNFDFISFFLICLLYNERLSNYNS